ncbi:MAG: hypothetical protein Q4F95_09365 [Oscillospiraceae bacterium]|nr:hypothetical protein [Oscillospiraceae bacterium]
MEDNHDTNNNLPVPEPLMPGEDAPSSKPPEHHNAQDKLAEILAHANAQKGLKELKDSNMDRQTIIYFAILLVLFVFSMKFLPHLLVIPVILSVSVIMVRCSMIKKKLDLKEALKDNIVLILLTGLFLFMAIINIIDV